MFLEDSPTVSRSLGLVMRPMLIWMATWRSRMYVCGPVNTCVIMETILHGAMYSVNKWYCWAIFSTIPLSPNPPRIIFSVSVSEKKHFNRSGLAHTLRTWCWMGWMRIVMIVFSHFSEWFRYGWSWSPYSPILTTAIISYVAFCKIVYKTLNTDSKNWNKECQQQWWVSLKGD
jgi:hypothetical protein